MKIKCLRSDNRGEYDKSEFEAFCADEGIRLTRTVPNKTRQNGVAERMNKTLNERAESMKIHFGLSNTFWVDAINTTVYLINRGPSIPLEFKLPKEVWKEKKTQVLSLENFWLYCICSCYPEKSDKVDVELVKCYLISYDFDMFRYKF